MTRALLAVLLAGCTAQAAPPLSGGGGGAGGAGSDTTAIHEDVAGEINGVAAEIAPEVGDILLIEDSSASFAKKKTTVGALAIGSALTGTLATLEGTSCYQGQTGYPTNAAHLLLMCRATGTWTYLLPGVGEVVIPTQMTSSTGWSWVNQGSATVTHGGVMSMYSPASAGLDQHVYVRTAPATPWTLTAIIDQKGGTTRLFGLYLRESGTGELYRFGTSLVGTEGLSVRHDTSATVSSTNPFVSLYDVNGNDGPIKLQIEDNGTTLYFRVIALRSGTVNELYSVARTTHMAAGPDQLGIGIATTGSPAYLDVLSWDLE